MGYDYLVPVRLGPGRMERYVTYEKRGHRRRIE
jgi:hypothetical protein